MTDETNEAPRRGRPPNAERATIELGERRRKRGSASASGLKLTVDMDKLDTKNFTHRWANDVPGRLRNLTELDDYEFVEIPGQSSANEGNKVAHHAGLGANNSSMRSYLVRKPKQWYDDDQREKQKPLDDIDHQIKRGTLAKSDDRAAAIAGEHGYVPEGSISIRDGRRK